MSKKQWAMGGAIFIVALLAGAAVYVLMPHDGGISLPVTVFEPAATSTPTQVSTEKGPHGLPYCVTEKPETATTTLTVVWHTPTPRADLKLERQETCEIKNQDPNDTWTTGYLPAALMSNNPSIENMGWNYYGTFTYYDVGRVTGGTYDGGTVVLLVAGDGQSPNISDAGMQVVRFIVKNGAVTLLEKNSDRITEAFAPGKFSLDTGSVLKGLPMPASFTYAGATFSRPEYSNSVDTRVSVASVVAGTDTKGLVVAFTHPTLGTVYTDAAGNDEEYLSADNQIGVGFSNTRSGLYVKAPDGTYAEYREVAPVWADENTHHAQITWDDGTPSIYDYSSVDRGGCGAVNYASVMKNLTKADITPAGKTSTGDTVYVLANTNHPFLKKLYEQFQTYRKTFAGSDQLPQAMTYDAFVKSKQLFFWYDPIGRLIKFQTDTYQVAECGKPVIYLYPTATTTVNVTVRPTGGMTVSDPVYNDGWTVDASPTSVLVNHADGKTYPYLFWEGRSNDIYQTPTKGWVVKRDEVHSFLEHTLAKFGLNAVERADFEEFWEPRMTDASYYFITFEGNKTMDAIAPLAVSPRPDTVIRLLMDFTPLEKPEQVPAYPEIRTPERRGFTVVEWGGVLR